MSLITEFKEFINRGNVVELAVGVILGAAFAPIIDAMVTGVLMPPVGMALGGADFSKLSIVLQEATLDSAGKVVKEAVEIKWGMLINNIIKFLITAFVLFLVIKAYNKTKKETPAAPAAPSDEVVLLTEIRDALKR